MNSLHERSMAQRGFTLIEAIIVMSIMAILAGVSTSSFVWLNQTTQLRTAAFDLVADLDFARSEAVKRNNDVIVAPVGGAWGNGWTVTAAATPTAAAIVLRQRAALDGQISFALAPAQQRFDGAGRPDPLTVGDFEICPPTAGALSGRTIRIEPSGRSRSIKTACA